MTDSKRESRVIRFTRAISLIGLIGLLLLALMIVIEGLVRWLFKYPIQGVTDVSSLVVAVAVASTFPLVFAERRSIRVRLIGNALGPRVNAFLESLGNLISLVLFIFITQQLWVYASLLSKTNERTISVLWPMSPWFYVASILIGLCLPAQAIVLVEQIRVAFSRKQKEFEDREEDKKSSLKKGAL